MSQSQPTSTRSAVQRLRLSALLLVVALVGCGSDGPLMAPDPAPNGAIIISGARMSFVTSMCEPGLRHFAAVGRGSDGVQPFVVVVKSPNVVTVAFDVTRELDPPPDDAAWYYAADDISLSTDGARIVGTGRLMSVRDAWADPIDVSLEITCRQVTDDRAAVSPALTGTA